MDHLQGALALLIGFGFYLYLLGVILIAILFWGKGFPNLPRIILFSVGWPYHFAWALKEAIKAEIRGEKIKANEY